MLLMLFEWLSSENPVGGNSVEQLIVVLCIGHLKQKIWISFEETLNTTSLQGTADILLKEKPLCPFKPV